MSNDPKHPVFGEMAVDATGIDLTVSTPEQIKKMSKVRPGLDKAVDCFVLLTAEQLRTLGITQTDFNEIVELKGKVAAIDELYGPAVELAHRLRTTRIARNHRLATLLHGAAAAARKRAKGDPDAEQVLGTLVDLLAYVSRPGKKAAATREKNANAKKG